VLLTSWRGTQTRPQSVAAFWLQRACLERSRCARPPPRRPKHRHLGRRLTP